MSPTVDAVPGDVWQRVFLFLASDSCLGPPSLIIPIILTNSRMHALLCACKPENAHLYAAVFVNHYDLLAPRRRLDFGFTTSSCCSTELRARFACIKRIRHRTHQLLDPDVLTQDLCRCFCMLMESDHKNVPLLFQYAGVTAFVLDSARDYLSETRPRFSHPIPHASFLLWLVWLVSTYNNLLDEDQHTTNELQERIAPYAISAWLYPEYSPKPSPFPDNSSRPFTSNPTPVYYTMTMFAHAVSIKVPPISPAAILSFCPRADACLIRWAHRTQNPENIQFDERVETAKRLLSSSVAALDGVSEAADSGDANANSSYMNHVFGTHSERFDDDWQRLLNPRDVGEDFPPYLSQHTHNNPTVSLSLRLLPVISGIWDGRMEYPDYRQYMSLRDSITPDIESYNNLFISSISLSCLFHVFYCTNSLDMLRVPQDGDSILNAWFPPGDEIEMTHTSNGDLRIWDRTTTTLASYKRFHFTDHELSEPMEILDIIITGTNISLDPGLAAQYKGRVTRDGLVVILRDGIQRGKELIRGYIHHGRNFVGRWRTAASPADSSSWEGPFIMARRND